MPGGRPGQKDATQTGTTGFGLFENPKKTTGFVGFFSVLDGFGLFFLLAKRFFGGVPGIFDSYFNIFGIEHLSVLWDSVLKNAWQFVSEWSSSERTYSSLPVLA